MKQILILLLIIVSCTPKLDAEVPSNVIAKYEELKVKYQDSLGAGIDKCVSDPYTSLGDNGTTLIHFNPQVIYDVWGSGGFSGVNYYYFKGGEEFKTYEWDDVMEIPVNEPDFKEPEPPINKSLFKCTKLISSR